MKSSDKVIQDYFSALLDDESALSPESTATRPESKLSSESKSSPIAKVIRQTQRKKGTEPKAAQATLREKIDVPAPVSALSTAPLQKLLDGVTEPEAKAVQKQQVEIDASVATLGPEIEIAPAKENHFKSALESQPEVPDATFQVLYFEVAGMTLAVPLEQLGGIYNVTDDSVRQLVGKPNWFKGLMPYRERQLNIVDTALWVMPEKYNENLAENLNYQYLVMLKDSDWGLACEKLVTTSQIEPSAINWRQTMGKRPWLRGMVKEKMCALLNVDALIELLDTGLNSQNI